jgi:general secretion pathway protein L
MSEFLVIRLGDSADQPAQWIAVDSSGARRSELHSGMLADAAADTGDRQVIVLVPSAEVLTTSIDMPVKGAKLQAALPYALEEYLADDVDDLHFAAGTRRSNGRTPVSVVSHDNMQAWQSTLAEAGVGASAIIAESYGLARIPGTISLLLSDDHVFINDGGNTELVMQGVSPGDALAAIGALDDGDETAGEDGEVPTLLPRHVLIYCDEITEERYQHDWIAMRQELDSVDVKLLPDGVMPRLAVTVATGAGINLLQGQYAAKRQYSGLIRPWKFAAALLLTFILVGLGAKGMDFYLLTRQESELRQIFNTEYQQMVPGAAETNDPARVIDSLRRRIGTGGATPVFLQSMEQLSRALQLNKAAKVQAISYRAGVIDLRVTAPDVAMLENIRSVIAESGQFTAAIQSADQGEGSVSSRIQIQESGS